MQNFIKKIALIVPLALLGLSFFTGHFRPLNFGAAEVVQVAAVIAAVIAISVGWKGRTPNVLSVRELALIASVPPSFARLPIELAPVEPGIEVFPEAKGFLEVGGA